MTTHFVFIRHGETDWNRQQRFQGQIDIPLNAIGLEQARRLGRHLAPTPTEILLCSDLTRAQQTAAPLALAWGQQAQALPGFREQSFGVLEGLDVPTIKAQHPELWQQWLEHRADFALPGGESLQQFHARVVKSVRDAAQAHPGKTLTVVTHGGVLDMLWRTVHGLPLDGLRTCDIPNTGINRLRWHQGSLELLQWAEVAHLQGMPEQPSTRAGER